MGKIDRIQRRYIIKRSRNIFTKIIAEDNLRKAIQTVCNSHRWDHYPNKQNKTVLWLEENMDNAVLELQKMIIDGFEPSPVKIKKRYDSNAKKWREISEPCLWPDQCVHHALIQVLQPIIMRGMDYWCCGSIKGRGAHYGVKAIKKWLKSRKKTKWCIELDIYHFYDSLNPELVLNRMKQLIKDYRALDLIERIMKNGILIGFYCSQWFANCFLQPLDRLIRQCKPVKYLRYMDNFTIFTNSKRNAERIRRLIEDWLKQHNLKLKSNWQKFKTKDRMVNALGYRYGIRYGKLVVLLRQHTFLKLVRQLRIFYKKYDSGQFITVKFAQGLLSRLGMLRHCNHVLFYEKYVRKHTQRNLKRIVKTYYRKEQEKWNMSTDMLPATA